MTQDASREFLRVDDPKWNTRCFPRSTFSSSFCCLSVFTLAYCFVYQATGLQGLRDDLRDIAAEQENQDLLLKDAAKNIQSLEHKSELAQKVWCPRFSFFSSLISLVVLISQRVEVVKALRQVVQELASAQQIQFWSEIWWFEDQRDKGRTKEEEALGSKAKAEEKRNFSLKKRWNKPVPTSSNKKSVFANPQACSWAVLTRSLSHTSSYFSVISQLVVLSSARLLHFSARCLKRAIGVVVPLQLLLPLRTKYGAMKRELSS